MVNVFMDSDELEYNSCRKILNQNRVCSLTQSFSPRSDLSAGTGRNVYRTAGPSSHSRTSTLFAPNKRKIANLLQRTGHSIHQENGQRIYSCSWKCQKPPRGSEVFVGKLPRDCFEDELVPIFEKIGPIHEMRLMMDFSGSNRGYCFVNYTKREHAKSAVQMLDGHEIRQDRFIGVSLSVDNCRLYLGGIPRDKTREDVMEQISQVTEGVVNVLVYPSSTNKSRNRGFAFIEYSSHRAAALARKKVIPSRLELWGRQVIVDWAEPEQNVDDEIMAKVKNLYVRNLMQETTEEQLWVEFERAAGRQGCIERVKRVKDFAFVHFYDRHSALTAMEIMNGCVLDGAVIEVTLAKPVFKSASPAIREPLTLEDTYSTPSFWEGLGTNGQDKSLINSHFHSNSDPGLPTLAPPVHDESVFNPWLSVLPNFNYSSSSYRRLNILCLDQGWEPPVFHLHSRVDKINGRNTLVYVYKVIIASLAQYQGQWIFLPSEVCDSLDQAREKAAAYTLARIKLPSHSETSLSPALSDQVQTPGSSTFSFISPQQVAPPGTPLQYVPQQGNFMPLQNLGTGLMGMSSTNPLASIFESSMSFSSPPDSDGVFTPQ